MPLLSPEALAAALPVDARLLGIDLGTRRIGLAVSDRGRMIATPVPMLERKSWGKDKLALAEIVARHQIGGFVCGLPLGLDGSRGPRAQASRQFLVNLMAVADLPACLWDERLSTAAVERAMIAADLSRAQRAQRIDSAAASYILQGALDYLRSLPASAPPATA